MGENNPQTLPSRAAVPATMLKDQGKPQRVVPIGVATIRRQITGVQVELEKLKSKMRKAKRDSGANERLTLLRQRGALLENRRVLQRLLDGASDD